MTTHTQSVERPAGRGQQQYRAALEEAFTFEVTWDGEAATPTVTGLAA